MNGNGNPYHGAMCPLCTSILTKPERALALKRNLPPLVDTENERNRLYLILWGVLREHGGEIVLRRSPDQEEANAHAISYKIDDDGALRISLPNTVVVESMPNIISLV